VVKVVMVVMDVAEEAVVLVLPAEEEVMADLES
jgi:hypothetical protein